MSIRIHLLPHFRFAIVFFALSVGILSSVVGLAAQDEATAGVPPQLLPVDESPGHPAFHRFWRKFQQAVEDRDGKFVLSVISEGIRMDFGGGGGRKEFVSRWKPADREGPLWKELDQIVRLGGTLDEEGGFGFTAPYAFGSWPENFDAFEYVFVNGRNVRFRSEPDSEAKVLRTVSWEIMKSVYVEGEEKSEWARLRAHDGQVGFVHTDYVRSSIDYRIGFGDDGKGGFVLDFFLEGD